jgi:hypothetical protein
MCGDGLFFEVPSLASDALLTVLYPLLENMLQTVDHFIISCLGAPFLWLEKSRNCMGQDLDYMADVLMGFHQSIFFQTTQFNSDLTPCDFWAFSTMKKRPSPHLHKVPSRSNKVSSLTLQMALV